MAAQSALRVFSPCQAELGESPVWDAEAGCLLCVDISAGHINALDLDGNLTRLYTSSSRIGALALTQAGNLIFAQGAAVARLDRRSLRVVQQSMPVIDLRSYRFNDGACDPQGRFITGLMDEGHSRNTGKLYRYGAGLNASVILDDLSLPNGLAWAADGQSVFFVDSVACRIFQARYLAHGDRLGPVRVFAQTPAGLGRPDGLAPGHTRRPVGVPVQRRLPVALRPHWRTHPNPAHPGTTPHQLLFWRRGHAHAVHYHGQVRDVGCRAAGLSGCR